MDNKLNEDDFIINSEDGNLIYLAIDDMTLKLINGSLIDFEDEMIRSAFIVIS